VAQPSLLSPVLARWLGGWWLETTAEPIVSMSLSRK